MSQVRRLVGGTQDRLLVGGILSIALLLRVVVVIATRHSWFPLNDGFDYNRIAASLAAGHGYPGAAVPPALGPSSFRPPLYPFVLTPVYWLVGVSTTAGRLENAVIGTMAVAMIGVLAHLVWGRRVGLTVLALAAVYPSLMLASFGLQYEALLIVLTCGSLAAGIQFTKQPARWAWLVLAGVLAGLAVLTRETASLLIIPLALLVWQASRHDLARTVARLAMVLVACVAVVAPWTIRNAVRLHAFVPVSSGLGYALQGTYNDTAAHYPTNPTEWLPPTQDPATLQILLHTNRSEVVIDRTLRSAAVRYIRHHPTYPVKVAVWNTIRLFDLHGFKDAVFAAVYVPYNQRFVKVAVVSFYLIGLAALVGAFTREARRAPFAVWLFPILIYAALVLVLGNIRYRAALEPFILMLAALGILNIGDRLAASRRARQKAPSLVEAST